MIRTGKRRVKSSPRKTAPKHKCPLRRMSLSVGRQADYVYYNATVINNNVRTDISTDDPPIYFQDTRVTPIIKDTSKYVVSVDNFTINGGQKDLPIFIPQIVVGPDINLTIYSRDLWMLSVLPAQAQATAATTYIQATIPLLGFPRFRRTCTVIPTTASPRQLEIGLLLLLHLRPLGEPDEQCPDGSMERTSNEKASDT